MHATKDISGFCNILLERLSCNSGVISYLYFVDYILSRLASTRPLMRMAVDVNVYSDVATQMAYWNNL